MIPPLISPDDHMTLWAFIAGGTAMAIWLEQRYRWASRLSAPVLALLMAMFLSNLRVVPSSSLAYDFVGDWLVPLAIPLLLFRANLREILRAGGRLFLLFHLSALGTLLGTALAVLALKSAIGSPSTEQAAGMMSASYLGGSVNFMAVKTSYSVPENVTNPLIVADNFVMAGMFVALLGIGASAWFRKRFPHPHSLDQDTDRAANLAAAHWHRKGISLLDTAKAFAFAFVVVALASWLGRGLSVLVGNLPKGVLLVDMLTILVTNKFVLITGITLTLATLLHKQLDDVNGPEEFGTYLLSLFLFTMGLPADLVSVFASAPLFFVFCAIIALTNLAFTLALGKLLRANLEEILIAVNANLGGAPSAAAMSISGGWPRLVTPGILVGVWGYVVGTPIGVLVTEWLLRS